MAACSILISVNIYERDLLLMKLSQQSEIDVTEASFFKDQLNIIQEFGMKSGEEKTQMLTFNTEIWNNIKVANLTGYSIEMLKEPLYLLSNFIDENLNPRRLEGFNLEALKDATNYNQ